MILRVFIIYILPVSLFAQAAILPFRVVGKDATASVELATSLQQGLHFLFGISLQYDLVSLDKTQHALKETGYSPEFSLNDRAIGDLCSTSGARFLLAGEVQYLPSGIALKGTSVSCSGRSVISRSEKTGKVEDLQRMMRSMVRDLSPFADERPGRSLVRKHMDVAVLVDMSGSMQSDLDRIREALAVLKRQVPPASRLGLVLVKPDDREILPFSDDWEKRLSEFQIRPASGEVSARQLEASVDALERFDDWRGERKLLIFSDAPAAGRRLSVLESRLRRLKGRGIDIQLYMLSGQNQEDRKEWQRLSRTLGLKDPSTTYGRRVGYTDRRGYSLYMIQKGNRFFYSDRDVTSELQNGTLDEGRLVPVETVHYDKTSLNLNDLPAQFAAHENLKLVGMDRVISDLPKKILSSVLSQKSGGFARYRVLLKNGSESFWIGLNDESAYRKLKAAGASSVYVGLRFFPSPEAGEPENLPDRVYVLNQADAPRIFMSTWAQISRSPASLLKPDDIHFLLCEIKDFKDEGKEKDVR
jgi:hypothetical protein